LLIKQAVQTAVNQVSRSDNCPKSGSAN
jgi:hypothetical protein